MKTHSKPLADAKTLKDRRGVALITVLTIISLCTILILTFFQLAQNEMVASDSYNNGLEASQVAEQAVNLVIRQIREATSDTKIGWASQPGVLRTWDSNGNFSAGYKLYSDDEMVVSGTSGGDEKTLATSDYEDLTRWSAKPWQYADLNEPVIRGEKVYYPIVDPTASVVPNWPTPLGEDNNGIEGFYLLGKDTGKKFLSSNKIGPVEPGPMNDAVKEVRSKDGVPRETLPMPVKWIYQLKDGTLGVLDDGMAFRPAAGGGAASEANPIVARFAFWADDETAKLNPNVHAGGAAWTTPMASGMIDRNLGRFQPTQHEWQRYPGHPATTHLAPVLAPGIADITFNRDNMESLFGLVPRIVGGGSASGTKKIDFRNPAERNGLVADKDRLYATLDEFFLEPGKLPNKPNASTTMRDSNNFPDPAKRAGGIMDWEVMQDHMERTKFFLSVASRAPETTMFNTPRISIWPTHWDDAPGHKDKEHWTPFDKLIRFCAEIGGGTGGQKKFQYHFQRYDADSATADFDDIDRNSELLDYLDRLTMAKVPGFGESFEGKYVALERRQILTEIFDYIRCVNLHDDSLFGEDWEEAFTAANSTNHRTFTNGRMKDGNSRYIHKGHGQVTPIRANIGSIPTKGFGRFYTMLEMGVIIINCADGGENEPANSKDPNNTLGAARFGNPGTTQYNRGWVENPAPRWIYSNLPPLTGLTRGNDGAWPQWLRDLKDPANPAQGKKGLAGEDLLDVAFDPKNWNWQLAWLDSAYEAAMPEGKFTATSNPGLTHLAPSEKLVQAGLVWNMFSPSLGWSPISPDMFLDFQIEGMSFEGNELGWKDKPSDPLQNVPGPKAWVPNDVQIQSVWHDRHYGGNKPFTYFLTAKSGGGIPVTPNDFGNPPGIGSNGRFTPLDKGYGNAKEFDRYLFATKPYKITGNKVGMTKGKVTVRIYSGGKDTQSRTVGSASQSNAELVQHIEIPFPVFSVDAPRLASGRNAYINEFNALEPGKTGPMEYWSLTRDGANPQIASRGRYSKTNGHHGGIFSDGDVIQSVAIRHGDPRVVAVQSEIKEAGSPAENIFQPHARYNQQQMAHGFTTTPGSRFAGADKGTRDRWLVRFANGAKATEVYHGDKIPYLMTSDKSGDVQRYGDFDNGFGNVVDGAYINKPDEGNTHSLFNKTDPNALVFGNFEMARDYGDFPYFVRDWIHEAGTPAYFSPNRIISSPGQFGSLSAGAVTPWTDGAGNSHMGEPWRTLLFRPNVEGGNTTGIKYTKHPGAGDSGKLPDHLFMDLFWMPVVEPYAISEPLSTAGKVNINYQILPFRHIHRSTAIRGVFKSEYMLCVPNHWVPAAKVGVGRGERYHWRDNPYGGTLESRSLRSVIVEDDTLAQFEAKFNDPASPTIFRSASEICDIHLIPQDQAARMKAGGASASINSFSNKIPTVDQMKDGSYWSQHATVGDNARERSYSNIYARITTKSNTFKVHYRAQVLRKAKGGVPGRWDPLVDQVVAEYRGASIIERYVEPNDPDIPDYANDSAGSAPPIDKFYKFRVIQPSRFAP